MRRKATVELNEAIRASILEPVLLKLLGSGQMEGLIEKVMKKEIDPYTAAEDIAKRYLEGCL
jgi:LAO/AO transport system kinase